MEVKVLTMPSHELSRKLEQVLNIGSSIKRSDLQVHVAIQSQKTQLQHSLTAQVRQYI